MALDDPALAELASHFGIASEFWDWKGRHTEVDDASVIAVLAAFEVDASTPEKAREAVGTHRTRAWQRALPPCVVLEQGDRQTPGVGLVQGQPFAQVERCRLV